MTLPPKGLSLRLHANSEWLIAELRTASGTIRELGYFVSRFPKRGMWAKENPSLKVALGKGVCLPGLQTGYVLSGLAACLSEPV